ncbi:MULTISPECIES: entericidin A/B family lipoprotein [Pokkaliibacter]|nr:entericidin A/B family lipoprotein [Pokkaliibacter plantistimulans]
MMRKGLLVMMTLLLGLSLSGCNTMSGIGKDIQKGGQAIEKAAKS